MGVSTRDPPGPHVHTLELSQSEVDDILAGKPVKVSTSEVSGHEHELELYYNSGRQRSKTFILSLSVELRKLCC